MTREREEGKDGETGIGMIRVSFSEHHLVLLSGIFALGYIPISL